METGPAPRTLMIFVDGFGIGLPDPELNPFAAGDTPALADLLARHAVPMDAGMGVPGLPQSATGQTALLTGINAAEAAGGHAQGFPGPILKALIERHNLFDRLAARGYASAFANAYYLESPPPGVWRKAQSVTTVAALKAFGQVRDGAAMRAGRAVYHDLTRHALRARGYEGPLVTPEEAAAHLAEIAAEHDFTLFEYFETDRMGHRGTRAEACAVAVALDRFVGAAWARLRGPRDLLVVASDHGNMEDMGTRQHTENPAVFAAAGHGAAALLRSVRRIEDVTPALLALYPAC